MRLAIPFALSLAVHFTLMWCLSLIPPQPFQLPPNAIDHFVEFVEDQNSAQEAGERKDIVRKQQIPREFLLPDKEVEHRYLSEDRQTVLEETRAAESGVTKNRALSGATENDGSLKGEGLTSGKRGAQSWTAEDGVAQSGEAGIGGAEDRGEELRMPNMRRFGLEAGRSTFGDSANPNLKIGQMTALNTDRFLYYSFYERAQDLIYHRWEKYVRSVLYSYQKSGAATGDEYWITRIEIVLDRTGNFVKGMVHQGSGLQGLDLAPVHAFREAEAIPNPPPEMVKDDGNIYMNWEFEVRVQSRLAGNEF